MSHVNHVLTTHFHRICSIYFMLRINEFVLLRSNLRGGCKLKLSTVSVVVVYFAKTVGFPAFGDYKKM